MLFNKGDLEIFMEILCSESIKSKICAEFKIEKYLKLGKYVEL